MMIKQKNFILIFVDSNKKITFVPQWNDKTILGDLNSNIFIEKFDNTPEHDIFFIKTPDTRIRMSGSILDLCGNYILVKKERTLGDVIICYEYLHDTMKLKRKWSHMNGVNAKFIQKKYICLLEKHEIRQNISLRETCSGTIIKKKNDIGYIDFGIKTSNAISAVSIDTISGITCLSLSTKAIKNELSLLPSLNGISSKTFTLPEGGEATLIYPKSIKGILITIHGGPESREWSNLRHGGLYRILLENNVGVLIYNYAGSSGLGKQARTIPHHRWVESITKESNYLFRILETEIIKYPIKYTILAGSFGATLALIISKNRNDLTLFLSSPMLNLKKQIYRLINDQNYKKWFFHRFSSSDINAFSLEQLAKSQKSKITIFHGEEDVICNPEDSKKFRQICESSINLIIAPNFGHVPESQGQFEFMYNCFYKKIFDEYMIDQI